VDGAALPGAAKHLRDRRLEASVGVGDTQLDAVQATGTQRAEELPPKRLGLRLAHVHADDLTAARLVHAVGDHQRLVAHPTPPADPLDLGVHPQVRVAAFQRPFAEDPDLLVQAAAQPGHLVLAQLVQAHLLHQPVDLARGHAVHIRFLHDRDQGLLGTSARLEEAREVAALPELGDRQLDAADPGIPLARPVAVAVGGALQAALPELGRPAR
jgi:hypothetical protein